MPLDMGSQAVNSGPIPGLQMILTEDHLKSSRDIHNNLPDDDILLGVVGEISEHLPQLRLLFEEFGVENLFGVHILHKHSEVPDGFHLVGRTEIRDKRLYYWTRVVDDTLNPSKVCGRKFVFDPQHGLYPYEFHEGPMPDLSKVDPKFFLRFTEYLVTHELTSILGLMYVPPELLIYDMVEFVLSNCRLLLVQMVFLEIDMTTTVTTDWRFSQPKITRKTYCIPDRNMKHPSPDDLLLQQYQISITDNYLATLPMDL
ncbi:hypothetical protein FPOAC2_13415 [Fusarium poae]|jgi:hypothetical protein